GNPFRDLIPRQKLRLITQIALVAIDIHDLVALIRRVPCQPATKADPSRTGMTISQAAIAVDSRHPQPVIGQGTPPGTVQPGKRPARSPRPHRAIVQQRDRDAHAGQLGCSGYAEYTSANNNG